MRPVTPHPHTHVMARRIVIVAGVLGAAVGALVAWTDMAISKALARSWVEDR